VGTTTLASYVVIVVLGVLSWRFVRTNLSGPNQTRKRAINKQMTFSLCLQVYENQI
jgi:hypothetical protein